MARKSTRNPFSSSLGLILFLVLLLIASFIYFGKNFRTDKNSEEISKEENESILKQRGINPEKVTIRYLDVESKWQDNSVAFSIETAYLTPDIADIGNWRNNYKIGSENQFLVIETSIRNRNTYGGNTVNMSNYLRLRDESNVQLTPADKSDFYLEPQSDSKFFTVFVVSKSLKQASLFSGILAKPKVTKLDFFDNQAKVYEGVFLYRSGLAPEYKEEK